MVSFSELQSANEEMSPSATHQTLLYMLATLGQWWRGGDNSPVGTGHPGRGGAGGGGLPRADPSTGRAQLLGIVLASDYQVNKVATQRGRVRTNQKPATRGAD